MRRRRVQYRIRKSVAGPIPVIDRFARWMQSCDTVSDLTSSDRYGTAVPLLRRSPMVKTTLFVAAVLCCGLSPAQTSSSVAPNIVASANGFLSSLDEAQRSKVLFEF